METVLQDIRYALRTLRKSPGFAAVAVLTLALGIGANTTIFSVVNTVLLQPLPFDNPSRLVLVRDSMPKFGVFRVPMAAPEFVHHRDHNAVFSAIGAFQNASMNLTGQGEPRRTLGARLSAGVLPLLGVHPALGRTFTADEDQHGRDGVVVLSHALWASYFGSDPAILGKTIRLDDRLYTVIGVMPASFQFPFQGTRAGEPAELWVPMALSPQDVEARATSYNLGVIARLKPGVTVAQAQANAAAVMADLVRSRADIYRGNPIEGAVVPLQQEVVGNSRPMLLLLLGSVGFVLLIACANVANLQLTRAASRQREMAIRSAIGARLGRLIRQLVTESLVLAVLGGMAGLALAWWANQAVVRLGPPGIPRLQDIHVDSVVLGFTTAVSLLTGVLFGLSPALHAGRVRLVEALKSSGIQTGATRGQGRLRGILVVMETALGLVLLVGAGLLAVSFVRLLRTPPGFEPTHLLTARTALPALRYPQAQQSDDAQDRIREKLAALPGVQSVAIASTLPVLHPPSNQAYATETQPSVRMRLANNVIISTGYFHTMGIPLLQGRDFDERDLPSAPGVVIVNQSLAQLNWPRQDPLGKRIKAGAQDSPTPWLTVVGVVPDVRLASLDSSPQPALYHPIRQNPGYANLEFAIRTAGDPSGLVDAMRNAIWSVDKDLPVFGVATAESGMAESLAQRRFTMLLLILFAGCALILAAVGLYAVVSYSVNQRTREIGIRIAMGARPAQILGQVLRQGTRMAGAGILLGLVAAFGLTRFMSSLLYDVSPADLPTFGAVAVLLAAVTLFASYIPARRATRVDPMVALRYE